jgi:hypothetical protein
LLTAHFKTISLEVLAIKEGGFSILVYAFMLEYIAIHVKQMEALRKLRINLAGSANNGMWLQTNFL